MVQPLWEKVWQFLVKLNVHPLSGVALVLLFVLVANLCAILATPWTVACQAPLSMGFSRREILEWVTIRYLPKKNKSI